MREWSLPSHSRCSGSFWRRPVSVLIYKPCHVHSTSQSPGRYFHGILSIHISHSASLLYNAMRWSRFFSCRIYFYSKNWTGHLADCNFITRWLYADCYWHTRVAYALFNLYTVWSVIASCGLSACLINEHNTKQYNTM